MLKKLFSRYGLAVFAGLSLAFLGPAVQVDLDSHDHAAGAPHATTVQEVDASQLPARPAALPGEVGIQAWPVPSRRSYTITASCQPYAAAIRQGAAAWQGLTEGGGTPIECPNP